MKDPLIDLAIQTNLKLLKRLNEHPEDEDVIFSRNLLIRGIEILQAKTTLTDLERMNIQRFCDKWGMP